MEPLYISIADTIGEAIEGWGGYCLFDFNPDQSFSMAIILQVVALQGWPLRGERSIV